MMSVLRLLPIRIVATAIALPTLWRVKRKLASTADILEVLESLDVPPRTQSPRLNLAPRDLLRGVRGALIILGPREDACVPRSMALFALLSRRGYTASVVSGVRREDDELVGHCWVLVTDGLLEGSGDHAAPEYYKQNLRYENRLSGGTAR
jgi:hypothetical protein